MEPRIYLGQKLIEMSQISVAVADFPDWKILLNHREDVPASVIQEVQEQILLGGGPNVVFSRFKAPE